MKLKEKFRLDINKSIIILLLAVIIGGRFLTMDSLAADTPGTSTDPLVSKSYVDKEVSALKALIGGTGTGTTTGSSTNTTALTNAQMDSIVTDVVAQVEFLFRDELQSGGISTGGDKYVPVRATSGQLIIGEEGTEIILRSGAGVAYSAVESGLVNVTTGREVFNNQSVALDNLLIVPRSDVRGLKITDDAWLIIKGGYELK